MFQTTNNILYFLTDENNKAPNVSSVTNNFFGQPIDCQIAKKNTIERMAYYGPRASEENK